MNSKRTLIAPHLVAIHSFQRDVVDSTSICGALNITTMTVFTVNHPDPKIAEAIMGFLFWDCQFKGFTEDDYDNEPVKNLIGNDGFIRLDKWLFDLYGEPVDVSRDIKFIKDPMYCTVEI